MQTRSMTGCKQDTFESPRRASISQFTQRINNYLNERDPIEMIWWSDDHRIRIVVTIKPK